MSPPLEPHLSGLVFPNELFDFEDDPRIVADVIKVHVAVTCR